MRNKTVYSVFALILLLLTLFMAGCKDEEVLEPEIEVDKTSIEIEIGKTEKINATIKNNTENLTLTFKTNNDKIATVTSDGVVSAVGFGSATITVAIKGKANIKKTVEITVPEGEITLSGPSEILIGETLALTVSDEMGGKDLYFSTDNNLIATVDEAGNVTGVSEGEVTITVASGITGNTKEIKVQVKAPAPNSIEITLKNNERILIFKEIQLIHTVLPKGANQDVIWTSSNEDIATVDEFGKVKTFASGEVEIIATSAIDDKVVGKITLHVEVDPIELLKYFHIDSPVYTRVKSNLQTMAEDYAIGSVNYYWPGPLNLEVRIIPVDTKLDEENGTKSDNPYVGRTITPEILKAVEFKSVRPGVKKTEIKSIIYHDTGNNNLGTGAENHANYMVSQYNRTVQYLTNGNRYGYRSWHYTVDDLGAIQHLPDDEIGFQGDTYEAYSTTIGIETSIARGSDFFTTWHRTAKLMASLLKKYDLKVDDVKQHYDFSQKDCPQVLRATGLWDSAKFMILAEYAVLTELEGYTITFTSHNPEYVNNFGRIIKVDSTPKKVSYTITITNNAGYNKSVTLQSTIPGKVS